MITVYHQSIPRKSARSVDYLTHIGFVCDAYYKEHFGTRPHIMAYCDEPFSSKKEDHDYYVETDQKELIERINNTCGMNLRPIESKPDYKYMMTISSYPSKPPTQEEIDNAKKFNEGLKSLLRNNPKK